MTPLPRPLTDGNAGEHCVMWAFACIGWGPASNAESDVSLICGLLRDDSPNDQVLPPKLRTSPGLDKGGEPTEGNRRCGGAELGRTVSRHEPKGAMSQPLPTLRCMSIKKARKQQVLSLDGERCLRCGNSCELEVDHIVPQAADGPDCWNNLQTLCRPCNQQKTVQPIDYRSPERRLTAERKCGCEWELPLVVRPFGKSLRTARVDLEDVRSC